MNTASGWPYLDDLGFDVEILIFQLGSLVGVIDGKYAYSQGEIDCILIFLRLMMESQENWNPSSSSR